MSKRVGLLRTFFKNFKNSLFVSKQKVHFVGTDKFGNKYFEKEADSSHNLRMSRYIEERKDIGPHGVPEVPVEWEAWLRGRRKDPPSPEEIERNYVKMMQTKWKADRIDKKYLYQNGTVSEVDSSTGVAVGEHVVSNQQKSSFPTYEEYEISPGIKDPHGKKS